MATAAYYKYARAVQCVSCHCLLVDWNVLARTHTYNFANAISAITRKISICDISALHYSNSTTESFFILLASVAPFDSYRIPNPISIVLAHTKKTAAKSTEFTHLNSMQCTLTYAIILLNSVSFFSFFFSLVNASRFQTVWNRTSKTSVNFILYWISFSFHSNDFQKSVDRWR